MAIKATLGVIATVIAFVSYVPYFRDIVAGKTKPHAISWFVWASLTAIGFAGQLSGGAGPGAWTTGVTALICYVIFAFALWRGTRNIVFVDWLCLAGAAGALVLWWLTSEPLLAVVLITIIDALGFVPTFRKSYTSPHEETVSTYAISSLKFAIAIMALTTYSLVTWLYPASLVVMNLVFVAMVMARRKRVAYVKVPT